MQQSAPRLVHLHIPKTAGTSLTRAFVALYDMDRVCPARYEPEFEGVNIADFDFFTGHIGFTCAARFDAPIVCLLRDPVDRFVSVYFYWRQLVESENRKEWGPRAAYALSLEEFAERFDESSLTEELYNRITWQIASSFHFSERRRMMGVTQAELLEKAIANLRKCAVVGRVEDMAGFVRDCRNTLGVELDIGRLNVTKNRPSASQVPLSVRRKIMQWVPLDLELYWSVANQKV